ncbi:4-vinyl reductase 4VR [Gemmatirosa kalamazoonensis]|jgi:predicted hydrocarbon binding protein|uniref:4-vinyl reductase 4VR n=1 Tax=Gemmatirosa kalamazoonensis TaxID=861299 RepID=W0RIV1_9BACT|nr:V4R domain-containing protein [Gemmatirosa kalamazoonensis]AHG90250.1 4-vinyl reductase 4VR [Gemmatirosa kalamazoonensis]
MSRLVLPAGALQSLRAAVLDTPRGAERLREAGSVAGLALYDDFAARVRERTGAEPEAMPLDEFTAALAEHLARGGWGDVTIDARRDADVMRLTSADWVEGEPDADAESPACHFSTGLLAGFFGRAAGTALAVEEVACRSTGAPRCEFVVGSADAVRRSALRTPG